MAADEVSMALPAQAVTGKGSGISISRSFAGRDEERLLNIAEAVYPPRPAVLRAVRLPIELYARPVDDTHLWWCGEFDGVLIPYAITKGAVAYYVTVVNEFRRGDFSRTAGIKMSASLEYEASVRHERGYRAGTETRGDVYVVSLRLKWSQYCGPVCAMRFAMERAVILDKEGKVLSAIFVTCH